MYTLPTSLEKKSVGFGTSTRTDWECTRMNKRDTYNPNGEGRVRVRVSEEEGRGGGRREDGVRRREEGGGGRRREEEGGERRR